MADLKFLEIDNLAEELVKRHLGSDYVEPIDIFKIIRQEGLEISFGNFSNKDISGYYDRENKIINIELNDSSNRKRFTAAHELGHHILHKNKEKEIYHRVDFMNSVSNEIDGEIKKEEQEANRFAAAILMPTSTFRALYSIVKNIEEMAYRFQVSEPAAYYRAKSLNLI